MNYKCPNKYCVLELNLGPRSKLIVRNGHYKRKSDGRKIEKFFCRMCGNYFSKATFSDQYNQKVRRINYSLNRLLVSGVSQRRAAKLLLVSRSTVERRFRFLAEKSRREHFLFIQRYRTNPLDAVQFDDLETSIHTKCKPASVALAVEPNSRKILDFQVSEMPAKGHLVKIAKAKYGSRPDRRGVGWDQLMQNLLPVLNRRATLLSDQNPHYPHYVKRHHPEATHETVKGGRGCVAGQGELKKLHFDPLFSLNHTCAMLRANMNRLFRRTWCTSKTIEGLVNHLWLYVHYHNTVLTPQLQNG